MRNWTTISGKINSRAKEKKSVFVGGEFYFDGKWQVEQPVVSTAGMTFLNGGKACLTVISDYLLDHNVEEMLLPSYICPTVVDTLEGCGLRCTYYQVLEDLNLDLEDLARKVDRNTALFFVNYFGFLHPNETRNFILGLKDNGILVVEDNAQLGFHQTSTGDFVFNSMRKLCPFDGGYLTTSLNVTPNVLKYHAVPNRRLALIRAYRQQLADYLFRGVGEHRELVEIYEKAEEYYDSDCVVEGDTRERWGIEHLDWTAIRQVRRHNYKYLLELIDGIPGITSPFPVLQAEAIPLGLPVYVNSVSRDWLLDELGNAGIGLTVHWDGLLRDPRLNHNPLAVDMAKRMLTLTVDQRASYKQLNYMAEKIASCMCHYRG